MMSRSGPLTGVWSLKGVRSGPPFFTTRYLTTGRLMNTTTSSTPSPHPVTPSPKSKDVQQMKQEFAQRIQFASMGDDDLVSCIVGTLGRSYQHREAPFHDYHLEVDLLIEECERREKPYLFDRAFKQFVSR